MSPGSRHITAGRLAALSFSPCLACSCAAIGAERIINRESVQVRWILVRWFNLRLAGLERASLVTGGLVRRQFGSLRSLDLVQFGIQPASGQQFLVGSPLHQFRILYYEDDVRVADGA